MDAFRSMLLVSGVFAMVLPVVQASAALDVASMKQYASDASLDGRDQEVSISQFTDLRPKDWAYQALSHLIERYGCVAGYSNSTYRGGGPLTRFEAAALLNACLDRVTEMTDELRRLMREFEAELAILKGRVDGLEAGIGDLEATQFSTTTRLRGLATFVLGANYYAGTSTNQAYNPGRLNEIQGGTAFNYDVRLNFDTSFTGSDLLRTTLRAGNFNKTAWSGTVLPNNSLEVAFQGGEAASNELAVNRLFYQFPIGSAVVATVGGRVRQDDMLAMWPSAYPVNAILDFFSYAGAPAVYSRNLGAGAGLSYRRHGLSVSANYVSQNAAIGNPGQGGIGTAGTPESLTAQVGYAADQWGIAAAYTYANGIGIPGGTPVASIGYGNGIARVTSVVGNSIGLSAYWQPRSSGWLPSISAGWGITGLSGAGSGAAGSTIMLDGTRIQSWSVGLQWTDVFFRGNDLGMAVGQTPFVTTNPSELPPSLTRVPNNGNYAWEWWYKVQVTDKISVTPALFYLSQPAGRLGKGTPATGAQDLRAVGGLLKTTFRF